MDTSMVAVWGACRMAVRVDRTPAMIHTMREMRRTEIPARRAASGLAEAARIMRPRSVRVNISCNPTAMIGARMRVTTCDDDSATRPINHWKWKGTG